MPDDQFEALRPIRLRWLVKRHPGGTVLQYRSDADEDGVWHDVSTVIQRVSALPEVIYEQL